MRSLLGTLLGVATCAALCLRLLGQSPLAAFQALAMGAVGSPYAVGLALTKATPLILVGLGIIVAFRAQVFNIGAEGQMIVGALAGTAVALSLPGCPGVALLPLALLAGTLAGAAWGAIPGVLKARLAVNEVLSTVMLNQVAAQLMIYLLRGPLIDPAELASGTHIPQSAAWPSQAWLWRPSSETLLHAGFLLALALAAVAHLALFRSLAGFRLRVVGHSPQAARYAGIPVPLYLAGAMSLSGALAGLAGAVEVAGVHHRALDGMSGGYGFAGIVAALLGGLRPGGLVIAACLFGAFLAGADEMQRSLQVPSALAVALQGLVVLLLMAGRK